MKDNGKKRILIILVIVLAIISIVAIILSLKNNGSGGGNSSSGTGNDNPSPGTPIQKEITELSDENEFFGIQNILNEYYEKIAKKNINDLYNMLDKKYISDNAITKNNIISKLASVYESTTFIAKEIYYNDNSKTTYYFINGYMYTSTMDESKYNYENNLNYLVVVDNDREYVIKPLDNDISISQYAKNYNLVENDFDNNMYYQKGNISEKNKLILYINEYLKLLFYDPQRAYNMLDSETKTKYLNYNDFDSQIINIYNGISTNIFGYASEDKEDYIEYKIKDSKQKDIKIIENKVMDYQIGY